MPSSTDRSDPPAVRNGAAAHHRLEEKQEAPTRPRMWAVAVVVTAGILLLSGLLLTADRDQDEPVDSGPPASEIEPEPPPPTVTLLTERFTGPDGVFVRQAELWDHAARGGSPTDGPASVEAGDDWFAESGVVERRNQEGHTTSAMMRMWTTRTDLGFTQAELDITFNGWVGDRSAGWHGVNLWMNRTLCSPVPGCTAVDDQGGNSGYVLDFVNRDGHLTILKKVPGDTRDRWPHAISYVQGGTYYELARVRWAPELGRTYRFGGRVVQVDDGALLEVRIDAEVVVDALDDGSVAGPILTGGRLGLRSDYADITFDNITVAR